MSEFILREDAEPVVWDCKEGEFLDSYNILNEMYPYMLERMDDEDFIIENHECHLFKELLYDNKVVGFSCYDLENGVGDLSLTCIYVLPEYRGNNIFLDEITELLENDITLSIMEPNNLVIDLLIKYGFARKLNDYLVASSISLDIPRDSWSCNDSSFEFGEDACYASNLYDLSICATLLLIDISSGDSNQIAYSRLLDSDELGYDAKAKREKLDDAHFDQIKEDLLSNQDLFTSVLVDLKKNLPKREYDIMELVGKPPEISDMLQGIVDEGLLSLERVKIIQKQLLEEYDNEEVRDESLFRRLKFLCMEDEFFDDWDVPYGDVSCPYCGTPINLSDTSCTVCGYNLEYTSQLDMDEISGLFDDIVSIISGDYDNDLAGVLVDETGYVYSLEKGEIRLENNFSFDVGVIQVLSLLEDHLPLERSCKLISYEKDYDWSVLYDYLLDESFVDDKISTDTWQFVSDKLTVSKLKDILRKEGLKVSGNKQELVDRIRENVDLSRIDIRDYIEISDGYIISRAGLDYLEENRYLIGSVNYLQKYDIDEFRKYHEDNSKEDIIREVLDFIDLHENKALKNEDLVYYRNVLLSRRFVLDDAKVLDRENFINEVKLFAYYLNKKAEGRLAFLYADSERIDKENVRILRKLQKKNSFNYEDIITDIYNQTDYEKNYALETAVMVLDEIFSGRSIRTIMNNLALSRKIERINESNLDDYL